jgi:acyl carrier protein
METAAQITETLRTYILKTFLPDENPDALTDTTPLVTGGILDSLATLKLVSFLEERYKIELQAHEVDVENLDTISQIARLVSKKLG